MRRTKLVCTIGPATASTVRLRQLMEAGADVLRLNFSHGTDAEMARRLMLTWGVTPVVMPAYDSMDTMIHAALRAAQATDLVTVGDLTVVVGGGPSAPPRTGGFFASDHHS